MPEILHPDIFKTDFTYQIIIPGINSHASLIIELFFLMI